MKIHVFRAVYPNDMEDDRGYGVMEDGYIAGIFSDVNSLVRSKFQCWINDGDNRLGLFISFQPPCDLYVNKFSCYRLEPLSAEEQQQLFLIIRSFQSQWQP